MKRVNTPEVLRECLPLDHIEKFSEASFLMAEIYLASRPVRNGP